jgi:DNA-binding transcriptional regulator YdaS (Cro superfamily)
MSKEFAIYKAGSIGALAKLLGISRAAISQWGATIPQARAWQLKALHPEWFDTTIV